jgi:hypothetical protein
MLTNEQPEDVMAETLRKIAVELGAAILREIVEADEQRED